MAACSVFALATRPGAQAPLQTGGDAALPPLTRNSFHTVDTGPTYYKATEPAPVYSGRKLVALTFDDGPNETYTPQVLAILKKEDVRATFFVIGVHMTANPSLVTQAAREGHQIGSHGWSHKDMTKLTAGALEKELADTDAFIKNLTEQAPTCVRPPLGALNGAVKQAIPGKILLWCVDPADWKGPPADATAAHVIKAAKDGDIVILHDSQKNTVRALPKLISGLRGKGFCFVTIDEMLRERPTGEQVIRFLRPK